MPLEKSTQERYKGLLKEYAVTANDPTVKGDWDKINSLFPEFESIDKDFLKNYAITANKPDLKGDWDEVNKLFPQTGIEVPQTKRESMINTYADNMTNEFGGDPDQWKLQAEYQKEVQSDWTALASLDGFLRNVTLGSRIFMKKTSE